MALQDQTRFATLLVIVTGTFWGLYWIPVRYLDAAGLPGAWGTAAIVGSAMVLLAPFAIIGRHRLAASSRTALLSVAVGGVAFVFYSVGFIYGRVAIIAILFFLTPVWSTLIGHFLMGWPTSRMRVLALTLGVVGLVCMLGAGGNIPIPRGIGEWLGLISGLLWSVATTGMRVGNVNTKPGETAFVFAVGATVAAFVLAPILEPIPGLSASINVGAIAGLALLTGGLWWGALMMTLLWATPRLEPARVGILLMAEVLIGAISAALIAGEHLGPFEILGGLLILCAGIAEVWQPRNGKTAHHNR